MRTITAIFSWGALGLVLAGTGCGNDSDGAGDKDQFISQLCAEFADCCEAAGRPSDGAQCRAFYGAFAPASGYDQAAASSCLDEMRALGDEKCDGGTTPSCSKVFASGGTKQPGEACDDDSDCVPSDAGRVDCVSKFVDGASTQQCQIRAPGKAGSAPCVGTVDGNTTFSSGTSDDIPTMGYLCDLADGVSCDSQTGACEALGAVGSPCSSGFYQCVPSAYCDFAESACKQRHAIGAACVIDDECEAGAHCSDGATCEAQLATGATCTTSAECASNNCTNGKCGAENDLALTFLCGSD